MKTFAESQFIYCPLIWTFHSRRLNKKISSLHGKVLRKELLDEGVSFVVHFRDFQTLAVEINKHIHGNSQAIVEVFKINTTLPYILRIHNEFLIRVPKAVKYVTERMSFLSSNRLGFYCNIHIKYITYYILYIFRHLVSRDGLFCRRFLKLLSQQKINC